MLREGIAAMLATEPAVEVVASAGSVEQGLEAFRTLQPDVTLMDLQMPGMGGIKGNPRYPRVLALGQSGCSDHVSWRCKCP